MRNVDNYCVCCALPCIHCGREKDVIHYSCDDCGADDIDGETVIYCDEDNHYCYECLLRKHIIDFAMDMMDEFGRKWVNENFEKVEEE